MSVWCQLFIYKILQNPFCLSVLGHFEQINENTNLCTLPFIVISMYKVHVPRSFEILWNSLLCASTSLKSSCFRVYHLYRLRHPQCHMKTCQVTMKPCAVCWCHGICLAITLDTIRYKHLYSSGFYVLKLTVWKYFGC